jgi:hypothetical protein
MTLPFVRARWQNFLPKAAESLTTTEIIRAQRPQQNPGDKLIHEFRLVVRRARQISPYVLCRGSLAASILLVHFNAVTLTSQPFPQASISRNSGGNFPRNSSSVSPSP